MRTLLSCLAGWALMGFAQAADWPVSAAVAEGSTSPDGRYGILVDDQGHLGDETVEPIVQLADLKTHRILGRIKAGYFAGMSLSVLWASDSSWAVLTYGVRDGFRSVELLQPSVSGVKETNLGDRIREDADRMSMRGLNSFVHEGDHGQIEFRATGINDPKGRNPKLAFTYFQGRYDPASSVWLTAKTRACSEEEWKDFSAAFARPSPPAGETAEEKTDRLDSRLNKIYTGLRHLLSAERFKTLKMEQRDWLAGPGKNGDAAALAARLEVLERLLWAQ